MPIQDSLIAARLAYGVDDFYFANPNLQQMSIEEPINTEVTSKLKESLADWDKSERISGSAIETFPKNMEVIDAYYDPQTHTSGVALKNTDTGEVTIGYSGTNLGTEPWEDFNTDGVNIANMQGEHLVPAIDFYRRVKRETGQRPIPVGHSLGANLAALVATFENAPKAYGFSPAPISVDPDQKMVLGFMTDKFDGLIRTVTALKDMKITSLWPLKAKLSGSSYMACDGFKYGLDKEYNLDFYNLVQKRMGETNNTMMFFAPAGDPLSQGALLFNQLVNTPYKNYSGNWVTMLGAGGHDLRKMFLPENFNRIKELEESGREWTWDSQGNALDINGQIAISGELDFNDWSKNLKSLIVYSTMRDIRKTLKKLDYFYDVQRKLLNDGPLVGSKEIYIDLIGTKYTTQGIIDVLQTQSDLLENSYRIHKDEIVKLWNEGITEMRKSGSLLSDSEIYGVIANIPLSFGGTVVPKLDELLEKKREVDLKISELRSTVNQINNDVQFIFDHENELAQHIEF